MFRNGYSWRGKEKVYNPFDVLLLFERKSKAEFDAWWFETGTPTFLVETLFNRQVGSLALGDMAGTGDCLGLIEAPPAAHHPSARSGDSEA